MKKVASTESIKCLDLSMRTYHLLRRVKIDTVGDLLVAVDNKQVDQIKGIGEKLSREIANAIRTYQIVNMEEVQDVLVEIVTLNNGALENNIVLEKLTVIRNAIHEIIDWQKETILKQVKMGTLHKKVLVGRKSLDELMQIETTNRFQTSKIYSSVLGTFCITEELAYLTKKCSVRDLDILIARYGLSPQTYEEIGDTVGVTRERIRQILKQIENRVSDTVNDTIEKQTSYSSRPILVRMQSALYLGEQQGLSITYDDWANFLIMSGLVGNWKIKDGFSGDSLELFIAICNLLSHVGIRIFSLPENLRYAINLAADEMPDAPAKYLQIVKTLPKKVKKEITRKTRFTGGVQARWLSSEINYGLSQIEDILLALGYIHTEGDWFIPKIVEMQRVLSRFDVLEHSARKMTQYCGPLSVENLCGGIMHTISRTRYPVPTPTVMMEILKSRRYTFEDDLFYWAGPIDETLNRGEEIIFDCMKIYGPVLHHAEIAQAFIDSELSFPSIHKTLRISPVIEKIDVGLYKLRGMSVTKGDIERAKNIGDRIPVRLTVNYDKSGKMKVEASLGILVVGTGVLFSDKLPNLAGEWKCVIDETTFDDINVMENEIRRLIKPLEYLQCNVGDRVCFIFDMWTRTVTLEKV